MTLTANGDLGGAIASWQELTAKEPSTENWNDLSYAYLLAGQYEEAVAAGEQVLALNPEHPAAQHNIGMAYLEGGNPFLAALWLDESARAQPERYEPLIGLARSALALGRAVLAEEYAALASGLAGGEAEAAGLRPALEELRSPSPAAESCLTQFTDGPYGLCLADRSVYFTADGVSQRIPVGPVGQMPTLTMGTWLDGGTAYWLKSNTAVLDVYEWRVFVVRDGTLRQVLFRGGTDLQMLNTDDRVKSYAMPQVMGAELKASHRHEADPRKVVFLTFEIAPDGLTAAQTAFYASVGGK